MRKASGLCLLSEQVKKRGQDLTLSEILDLFVHSKKYHATFSPLLCTGPIPCICYSLSLRSKDEYETIISGNES